MFIDFVLQIVEVMDKLKIMNSYLIQVLRSLNKKEIRDFLYYVKCPLNNKNKRVSILMDLLIKLYPDFEISQSKLEWIQLRVCGAKDHISASFRNVVSDLLELAENYLVRVNLNNNNQRYNLHLLNELNKRKLNNLFKKRYGEYTGTKNNPTKYDLSYFLNTSEYYKEIIDHQWLTEPNIKYESLSSELDELYRHFIVKALINYSYLATQSHMFEYVPEYMYLDVITNNPTAKKFIESDPYLMLNFLRFKLLYKGTDKDFDELFMLWKKSYNVISAIDNINTAGILENFCIININNYNAKYKIRYLELLKHQHENKFYSTLPNCRPDMITVITVALQSGEKKWLEQFYQDIRKLYKDGLLENENYFRYMINYKEGMLNEAFEELNKVKHNDHYHTLWIRKERLKLIYELGMVEMAFLEVDSMKHFIKNAKELQQSRINRYKLFALQMERLLKLRAGSKKYSQETLTREIELGAGIEKSWFIRMIKKIYD